MLTNNTRESKHVKLVLSLQWKDVQLFLPKKLEMDAFNNLMIFCYL